MRRFANLVGQLERTTSNNRKVDALVAFFREVSAEDSAWAVYFLTGNRLSARVSRRVLREVCMAHTRMAPWLFDESYRTVGDLAETLALLWRANLGGVTERQLCLGVPYHSLALFVETITERLSCDDEAQGVFVCSVWNALNPQERFVFNKMITGGFRVGVSKQSVVNALHSYCQVDKTLIMARLMGAPEPSSEFFRQLTCGDVTEADSSRPFPFYLASPLESQSTDPANPAQEVRQSLGDERRWFAEWKWDGIRAQLVFRRGEANLWSRGEELVTGQFPEVISQAKDYFTTRSPVVLDGELLAYDRDAGRPLPFSVLQRRLGRKRVDEGLIRDAPVVFMAYDVLEVNGEDQRMLSTDKRRVCLHDVLRAADSPFPVSPTIDFGTWEELLQIRNQSRDRLVEGVMLKLRDGPYEAGRRRGAWWKWKVDPFTVDAVLIHAQVGHGRRANLYTDYTFGVWRDDELVPVAKAYSGLTDVEIAELDRWIRKHTKERFGPVRSVEPHHVFEIAFEGIQESGRHRSGVAVRFPRIVRWRRDKPISEADALENLRRMIRR